MLTKTIDFYEMGGRAWNRIDCDHICNRCEGSIDEIQCFIDCVPPNCSLLKLKCRTCPNNRCCAGKQANEQGE